MKDWKTIFSATAPPTFISHMVQMKVSHMVTEFIKKKNFISHMVQMKAERRELKQQPLSSLYPTWFRWKLHGVCRLLRKIYTLYPTWFRWKLLLHPQAFGTLQALYPTWFRWKDANIVFFKKTLKTLYPTWFRWKRCMDRRCIWPSLYFISHMVQMKGVTRC